MEENTEGNDTTKYSASSKSKTMFSELDNLTDA